MNPSRLMSEPVPIPALIITLITKPPYSFSLLSSKPGMVLQAAVAKKPLVRPRSKEFNMIVAGLFQKTLSESAIKKVVAMKVNLKTDPITKKLLE